MSLRLRPTIEKLQPYKPGKPIDELERELGLQGVVKLASNENPLGPSPKAIAAAQRAIEQSHLYPDANATLLKRAIAAKTGVPEERVMIGNGSDSLLQIIGAVLLGDPEDEVVMAHPSFVRYAAPATLFDARLVQVPLREDMTYDLDAMAAAVTPRTKLVFIANPNNPTGTMVRRREFESFLSQIPEGALVVLDEAYFEYAREEPDYPDSTDYVNQNVVGLRTFSKAYGLAGFRVGYGWGPPEIVDAVERVRDPFLVNAIGQAAALAALDDQPHVERTLAANREGRARLVSFLERIGARVFESHANFVFADIGRPSGPVFEGLLRQGVIVRPGTQLGMTNALRVSVGTMTEIERFEDAYLALGAGVTR